MFFHIYWSAKKLQVGSYLQKSIQLSLHNFWVARGQNAVNVIKFNKYIMEYQSRLKQPLHLDPQLATPVAF